MTISSLLGELNISQRAAATASNAHTLVLAGAGCGKTKTIIARAAYLVANGTPANRIQILTFTRRAAAEIVERVKTHLGDNAADLRGSTFHTWCVSLIRRAPVHFASRGFSIIDRDDQLQLFKALRGKKSKLALPTAGELCDLYSLSRNMDRSLEQVLVQQHPEAIGMRDQIGRVMLAYEERKAIRRYLDYDDILAVVAHGLATSEEARYWVSHQYDHLLVDEMQDTNPLQWRLLDPLRKDVTLFCVGDDAQSIYGFRGADFRNVHSFGERVANSITLRLEDNYRSTQEILDLSNWLLDRSPLAYNKHLHGVRGSGFRPQLHTFRGDIEEGRWIAEDLSRRRAETGAPWREHMILVRSTFAARPIEAALLAKEIPYVFIGGTKLLESAHVRDALSALRVVGNPQDEIAWMRFLSLWPGVGEVTATKAIDQLLEMPTIGECIALLGSGQTRIPAAAPSVIEAVLGFEGSVSRAFAAAVDGLVEMLAARYATQDWERRKGDFRLVEQLAAKHTSVLAFVEEYLLDPIHPSQVLRREKDDVVSLITIHSAKGTESRVCYVANVSPGAYPSQFAAGNADDVEEERRVLYVAMTRAKDELIVTRHGWSLWAEKSTPKAENEIESYFLNDLPPTLVDEHFHEPQVFTKSGDAVSSLAPPTPGISLGFSLDSAAEKVGMSSRTMSNPNSNSTSDSMARSKLQVIRFPEMESAAGMHIEFCSAYLSGNYAYVIGEIAAADGAAIPDARWLHALFLDANNEPVATEVECWPEFGSRRTFKLWPAIEDAESTPVSVRLYPTTSS